MFDYRSFFADYHISIAPSTHKHYRFGWINIACPFCTGIHKGYHLGFDQKKDATCYRCGWHSMSSVIEAIAGIKKEYQKPIWKKYYKPGPDIKKEKFIYKQKLEYPSGIGSMERGHYLYLMERKYNPIELKQTWKLLGTNYLGNYKFRIIAPIEFQHRLVSYQGRDITGKQDQKYKACAKSEEVIHHKHVLYGFDKIEKDKCLVVEGITGVWRFGPGCIATFGASVTPSQIRLMADRFKRIFLMMDSDEAGQKATEKMEIELSVLGKEVIVLNLLSGDSGEICQNEANYFMKKEIL